MILRVLFFGRLKDIVGMAEDSFFAPEGCNLRDVYANYAEKFPRLGEFRQSVAGAVNQEYSSWDQKLRAGDEVAFLPPVSGGAAAGFENIIKIVRKKIAADEIVASLKAPEDGALAVFEGIVRNHCAGKKVLHLEYEAYDSMALAKMRAIGDAMEKTFAVDRIAIVHRLGRMEIGETSVLVAVSSAHRAAAFDACRYAIDTLKKSVPIWKKEFFADGAVWSEGEKIAAEAFSPESTSSS